MSVKTGDPSLIKQPGSQQRLFWKIDTACEIDSQMYKKTTYVTTQVICHYVGIVKLTFMRNRGFSFHVPQVISTLC